MTSHQLPADLPVDIADELAATSAHLYSLGWMRGTSGNVSTLIQREPLRLAVSASGVSKHRLRPEHAVVTDVDGVATPGQHHRPSAEAKVHGRILDHTGAGSVVHVHAVSCLVAAERWPSGIVLGGVEQLKGLGLSAEGEKTVVPVVANSQDMEDLSNRILKALNPEMPAIVVASHGMYVWGADLEDASNRTESLDWLLDHALALETHRRDA
jgi:methylthioribulose-1-phosphate dehydratase